MPIARELNGGRGNAYGGQKHLQKFVFDSAGVTPARLHLCGGSK
jgi:hypothetical protein